MASPGYLGVWYRVLNVLTVLTPGCPPPFTLVQVNQLHSFTACDEFVTVGHVGYVRRAREGKHLEHVGAPETPETPRHTTPSLCSPLLALMAVGRMAVPLAT